MANHLFLIGIDEYLFHDRLNNCVKDSSDIKTVLLEKFEFEEEEVTELYNGRATSKNIQDVFTSYSKTLSLHDNLVVYFSGHGHFEKDQNVGFWIPVDGSHSYTTWISNDIVISALGRIECKHIFLISDSCFSNTLFIQNATKGIIDYSNYKSRWALTSSFQAAYDSDKGTNGPFAKTILEYLSVTNSEFRVGAMVEYIKTRFEADQLQSPQGSALYCKGHSGGEMIFRIKQHFDNRKLKGYNDFRKALQLYKRKSTFIELSSYEDKSKKVGFQLFQEVDPVIKKMAFYLYLYEGIVLNQTYKYLFEKHPEIFKEKNLIIFLPKELDQTNPKVRQNNLISKFKPISLFYIDEFILEQCTPEFEIERSSFLGVSNFVLPSFSNGLPSEKVQKYIENWFAKESDPVLAVKGTGGIGKTTFAHFIADLWITKSKKTNVVYIDSIYIKDVLMRKKMHLESPKIYDFYEAFCEITGIKSNQLNEELFKLNVDAGNLMIIIDGLDEVISKIPHFKISTFLSSITETSRELASGKVVITCRTHFWDTADVENTNISVIELEPFNIEQARIFFEKCLDSTTKVKKALKISEQFRYPGVSTENQFHPYVLDVIRSIVSTDKDSIELDLSEFSSKLLSNSVRNDYIIYRICDRERKRIGQTLVDDQIKFFIHIATHKRGIFKVENLKSLLTESLEKKIEAAHAIGFKSHPFLSIIGDSATFRYDFLTDLFKGIYLAQYFDFERIQPVIDDIFLNLIEENCWYGSPINQDIINRINRWNEYDILAVSDLMRKIRLLDILDERRNKIIANIFNISIGINHKFFNNDIDSNTKLFLSLFKTLDGEINNFCISKIDFENHVRFDFSGLTINKSYINGYSSFWDCKFDKKTLFKECWLLNLKARAENQNITQDYFIDCIYDRDLEDALKKFNQTTQSKIEVTKEFLNDFFHLFFSSGKLGRQWEHKIIEPRFVGIARNKFNYRETIKILRSNNVLIVTKELGQNKFSISEQHKEAVVRFSKDGTISTIIVKLIQELSA